MINLYAQIRRNELSFFESMSLTDLPIIILKVNNINLNFLLDTGSMASYINKVLIDTNSLGNFISTDKKVVSQGIEGGSVELPIININLFTPKGKQMNTDLVVRDMSTIFSSIKEDYGVTINGLLGNDFFQKYKYIIDFNELIAYEK